MKIQSRRKPRAPHTTRSRVSQRIRGWNLDEFCVYRQNWAFLQKSFLKPLFFKQPAFFRSVIFVVANFSHSAKNIFKREYSVKIPLLKRKKRKKKKKTNFFFFFFWTEIVTTAYNMKGYLRFFLKTFI
jgi:hypothetical protein